MFKQIYRPMILQTRNIALAKEKKIKPQIIMDKETEELIKKDELKPRKHSGVVHRPLVQLPEWVTKAMLVELEDYPHNEIKEESKKLYQYLNGRHPPTEQEVKETKMHEIVKSLMEEKRYENMLLEDNEKAEQSLKTRATKKLKKEIYNWVPMQYDKHKSLLYMVGRGAQDYAILYKVLSEIKYRDKEFKPKTLFDFGSGIGTVSWAANELWNRSLKEYICVDISSEASDLACSLANRSEPKIKNIFHRQYLPVSNVPTSDIVVSAFTLMELPDRRTRIDTLLKLWSRTEKYLVIVEQGTTSGFSLINEARDFFTHLWKNVKSNSSPGYFFSPCPHEFSCPRLKVDNTPCNFDAHYFKISLGRALEPKHERYSYLVIRKGDERDEKEMWPRLIRPVVVRSRHSICRLCNTDGKLQEIIFSAGKHERPVFYTARSSRWGDRLPMVVKNSEE